MPQIQHVGKHFPLSLLTPYLLSSQWQSLHQCGVCIGLYTVSSRQGLHMCYHIVKGVSERCIARLFLTIRREYRATIAHMLIGCRGSLAANQCVCHSCTFFTLIFIHLHYSDPKNTIATFD